MLTRGLVAVIWFFLNSVLATTSEPKPTFRSLWHEEIPTFPGDREYRSAPPPVTRYIQWLHNNRPFSPDSQFTHIRGTMFVCCMLLPIQKISVPSEYGSEIYQLRYLCLRWFKSVKFNIRNWNFSIRLRKFSAVPPTLSPFCSIHRWKPRVS